jgi:hypothetical protein
MKYARIHPDVVQLNGKHMARRGRGFWSQQFTDEDYRQRLKSKCVVDPLTGCWVYQGFRHKLGYGDFSYRGVNLRAHRVAYTLWKGEIPAGLDVLHRCDNPPCCNPDHLRTGDPVANSRECVERGRHHMASRETCSKGHPYAIYGKFRTDHPTWRICTLCVRERYQLEKQRTKPRRKKGFCRRGHEIVGENIYPKPGGGKQCRICHEVAERRGQARRAEMYRRNATS